MGELEEDDPLRYVDYKTTRNILKRSKTLPPLNMNAPFDSQMIQKINNVPPGGRKKRLAYVNFFSLLLTKDGLAFVNN